MLTTSLPGCASAPQSSENKTEASENVTVEPEGEAVWLRQTGSLPLKYAERFSVDFFEDGVFQVTIDDSDAFLVVEEGGSLPEGADSALPVMYQPFSAVYLASSQTMDFFRKLECLDQVRMTSTKAQDWSLPDIREKVEAEEILYIGKYNAPDYERLLSEGCDLCVENTMIYHNPEAKELIEKLSIPVIVDKSSYEADPLGRMEWIKLYGCLMGKREEAESFFDEKAAEVEETLSAVANDAEETKTKTVAFFYITANGQVSIRKPGDYITKMIELAGGSYVFSDPDFGEEGSPGGSSMTISMEEFYDKAREADILIYNSTIDAELQTIDELLLKSPLLADFSAVQKGNVWGTEKDLFQEITGTADMIRSLSLVINGEGKETGSPEYMHKLI